MRNPRFVLAVGSYAEAHPDMSTDLPVCVYDRQEKRIVVQVMPHYQQAICLETTRPDGSPFSTMVDWLNNMAAGDLASEGIPDTRPEFNVSDEKPLNNALAVIRAKQAEVAAQKEISKLAEHARYVREHNAFAEFYGMYKDVADLPSVGEYYERESKPVFSRCTIRKHLFSGSETVYGIAIHPRNDSEFCVRESDEDGMQYFYRGKVVAKEEFREQFITALASIVK